MNKKGFVYMFATLLIVAMLFGIYLYTTNQSYQERQEAYSVRIHSVNDFVKSFNEDMKRAITISSYRTFIGMEDVITTNGAFFESSEEVFAEILYFGSLNEVGIDVMDNASVSHYISRVSQIANSQGVNLTVNVTNITLEHVTPWVVNVTVNATIQVYDLFGGSAWIYNKSYSNNISILHLRDPIYGVFSDAKVINTIIPSSEHVSLGEDINLHVQNSYYIENPSAPSFLQRFENNYSSSEFGIESIVNIEELSIQEISVHLGRIKVDYIYFNNLWGARLCDFEGLNPVYHFIITPNRLELYGLEELDYEDTC